MKRLIARTTKLGIAWGAALAVSVSLGCASTPEEEPPAPEPEETGSEFVQPVQPTPEPVAMTTVEDLGIVYFDFERSEIRSDARPILRNNAADLKKMNGRITIEGHTDERGSEEYNLALGERRANAVRKYLVNLGVSSSDLRVVSYGEAKPAARGHDESAWRWNRRAEFSQ